MKNNERILLKRHNRMTSPQYLFQVQTDTSKLHAMCIPKKKLQTYAVDFTFSYGMGFTHVENRFYVGGGNLQNKIFAQFRTKSLDGEITKLQNMPTPKSYFAMILWKQKSTLITVGGYHGSPLKQVQKYSLSKNRWNLHSQMPEALYCSSAVVLNNVMYNIGGLGSSHCVLRCQLAPIYPPKWEFMDLPNYSFIGHSCREAFVMQNKIVYFGSQDENTTFVLEEEKESEQLKVVREDEGFDFRRGIWNTGSCLLKLEIYAFKTSNYKRVHRYSLESGKWTRFYPQK